MNQFLDSTIDRKENVVDRATPSTGFPNGPSHFLAIALAIVTTLTSTGIAVMSGLQRAATVPAQAACVALAVAAVVGAHLLPAVSRGKSIFARYWGMALSAASLLVALYGQVSFFVVTQQKAGERRAETVTAQLSAPEWDGAVPRTLMAIAAEEQQIRTMLAINDSRRCYADCPEKLKRHDVLDARLRALAIEEHEARRRENEMDRRADSFARLRDSAREDPATARLARATGMDQDTFNLAVALVCACVLDLTSSFCWFLALGRSRRDGKANEAPVVATSGASRDGLAIGDDVPATAPEPNVTDSRLLQLVHDVAAGEVRPTIDGIREHFNCAQKTATDLRRRYYALYQAVHSAAPQI
ncbi:putative twin-arginine translocation pathway signal protein [Burkholderia pseudomallei]|uniref:hypothetical protein n=1 Tax=Burkholderia pseudomallei TaxID=28450 RepID=UPI000F07E27A|nr:hypothetical protein [Burkholderia pseudomallei]VBR62505.1 putative twin-arginine translocation pathway signal protein [Burkholderia pseudomallei]